MWQLSREGIERESIPFQQFEQSGLFARGRAAGPPRKKHLLIADASFLEAPPRFELGQSRICSPLPYHLAMAPDIGKEGFSQNPLFFLWSGLRGSNSLPPPWQGGALPDELRPQMVPQARVELATRGFSVRCSTY